MTSQLIITLAILAFMIVMFVWQKFPMGVTTMTCCALLAAFGILSPLEAFGGFTNNSIILVAPMMALSSAITKTSIVPYIRNKVNSLSGKKGIVLILFFYLIVIAFVQFIPATATFSIMIVFLASLSNDGEVTPTRMTIPLLAMIAIWGSKLPIGMGAASHLNLNARYEGMLPEGSEGMLLDLMTRFKVMILPCIILTVYCLFAWKWLPNKKFDSSKLETKTMNLPSECVQVVNLPSTYTLTVETERLMNVTLCGPAGALETLTPEVFLEQLKQEKQDGWVCYLHYTKDVADGMVSVNHKTGQVEHLFVSAAARGKGIGMKMLDFARKKLPEHPHPTLTVLDKNTRALALYRRMGWKVCGVELVFDPAKDRFAAVHSELLVMRYEG